MGTALRCAVAAICLLAGCSSAGDTSMKFTALGRPSTKSIAGPIYGVVLGPDGRPASNVKVSAMAADSTPLISNNSGSLGAKSAGSLVSTSPGGLTAGAPYRLASVDGTAVATTGPDGSFVLSPAQSGTYNIEADLSDSYKAWKAAVNFQNGSNVSLGSLKLLQTGSIHGFVRSSLSSVTDFTNTHIYIPGSSYSADAKDDGSYTISFVPQGAFELRAFSPALGDAGLPDGDHPGQISVGPDQSTEAPPLVLATHPPEITGFTRANPNPQDGADTGEKTDNGAAGQTLYLHGHYLGFNRGLTGSISFGSALIPIPSTAANRQSEDTIKVIIPNLDGNANIAITLGSLVSNSVSLRTIVRFGFTQSTISLQPGSAVDLYSLLTATDGKSQAIVAAPGIWAKPNVDLRMDETAIATLDGSGQLRALSNGTATVSAAAGSLISDRPTLQITISNAPPVAPTSSPIPSFSSPTAPTPTPASGFSPVPVPSSTQGTNPSPGPTSSPPSGSPISTNAPAWISPADATSWTVETYAGNDPSAFKNGQSAFSQPTGVAADDSGNLYVTDQFTGLISRVAPDRTITTWAGGGPMPDPIDGSGNGIGSAAGFDNPAGICWDPHTSQLYVADMADFTVRRIDPNRQVSTVAGAFYQAGLKDGPPGTPRFHDPYGIAIDNAGNLYVSALALFDDQTYPPGTVYQILPDGSSKILAGSNLRSSNLLLLGDALRVDLTNPFGVAVDPTGGNLYITDHGGNRVARYAQGQISTYAGSDKSPEHLASLKLPQGIALDRAGNLFIADTGNNKIRVVLASGVVRNVAGNGQKGLQDGPGSNASFNTPVGLYVDRSGRVYVADRGNSVVRRIVPNL